MALPDAATKLRMVLDYLPCEACLAQPVDDQDLLCTICARVDRQVAVRVGSRTNVLLERPTPPPAPVVIPSVPPAPPEPPAALPPPAREIVVRMTDEPSPERPGTTEVVLEPLAPPAPPVVAAPEPAAVVPLALTPEPAPEPEPEEPEFDVSDIVEFLPARDQFFDYTGRGRPARREPEPAPVAEPTPEPEPEPVVEPAPQDDYVFAPPPQEPEPEPEPVEEVYAPVEEVPVEAPEEVQQQWAPPEEAEEPQPWAPAEEPIAEPEVPAEEDEVLEMELVEDEEDVVEMELVEDDAPEPEPEPEPQPVREPAPEAPPAPEPPRAASPPPVAEASSADLYRLRGFEPAAEGALARLGITQIAHLSGHDAGDLATRASLPFDRVLPWVQVADLVHEVGVPVDAANALVAAGVAGPRGLRDVDPEAVADRVAAFGGYTVSPRDVKRWQRRA